MIKRGDKVKQRADLVTVWAGPNSSQSMDTETVYTVSKVFKSAFSGKPYLNADNGHKFTGGPVNEFVKVISE